MVPRHVDDERAAIEGTIFDYVEGWFEGDGVRMKRALHPELVKRTLERDGSGRQRLRTIGADWMVEAAARGDGQCEHPGELDVEIEVVSYAVSSRA